MTYALELINEAVAKAIPFSAVVVDAWYTSTDLIEFVASRNLSASLKTPFALTSTKCTIRNKFQPACRQAGWIKQNGCLSKILNEPRLETIGECKQAVASLIILDSAFLLSKNKNLVASLYNVKSERFKKKLQN